MLAATVGCCGWHQQSLGHIPLVPPGWFNALAGVGHSQAIWPQPWHLKHQRELGSLLLVVPSCLSLSPWLFYPWSLLILVPVLQLVDVLQPKTVCPRLVWPLWELGLPGVLNKVRAGCPLLQPLCLGLFRALAGLLACPALVRVAINLAIWCPSFRVPPGLLVMAALALTLLWASSFSLSTLWVATLS